MDTAIEKTEAVKEFFDHWIVYRKFVEHNYAGHREVYAALHRFLILRFHRPFVLLDFGCGDAGFMTRALAGTDVAAYQGVDISTVALDLAKQNMKTVVCRQTFLGDDFVRVTERQKTKADVIWIGLSFHHLSSAQKDLFLGHCRRILGASGYLLIFDPVRRDTEDRQAFLLRWKAIFQARWTAFSEKEKHALWEHVRQADFPESLAALTNLGHRNRFNRVLSLFTDPTGIYQLVCFHA